LNDFDGEHDMTERATLASGSGLWIRGRASHLAVLAGLALSVTGCGLFQPDYPSLAVADDVDFDRYLGRWYEIARYPNDFEQGCRGVTANYTELDDGRIRVLNTCRDDDGDLTERIAGVARVVGNAKLKVSFFWPFEGDYWILEIGPDYEYAVVGEPSREFFWILSRTPTMDDATLQPILDRMPEWRYDPDRLYFVPQFDEPADEQAFTTGSGRLPPNAGRLT